MSDKTTPAKPTKAELRKMLEEAVLNTPGATQLKPVRDALSEPMASKPLGPKRVGKSKRAGASSTRKSRTAGLPAKGRAVRSK
ncbi:hypothetical protein [Bradyrhizobium sp. STM 3557]|uniref:hypothetical protein n=1 Tax=Bradyrhizobium sp. STM 3557 TaxID=578920 RepID=UPI00388D93CE